MKLTAEAEALYSKIMSFPIVSFDIFDTLLKRNVENPFQIFSLLEEKAVRQYGEDFQNLRQERIQAEKNARTKINGEVTLDQIYNELPLGTVEQRAWLKQQEIDLELKYCTQNTVITDVYAKCLEEGKRVIIVSDMYLPKEVLVQMLHNIGISSYEGLWVSNESGLTKSEGTLFAKVTSDLNVVPELVVHIGDNKKSDFLNAKKAGWHALLINTQQRNLNYFNRPRRTLNDNIAFAFTNNNIVNEKNENKLGFETMGPLLYGFSKWLEQQFRNENISQAYFLSRDGLIMKKAFDLLENAEIETHYLYASRRALQVPILAYDEIGYQDFIKRIHWPSKVKLRYYLYCLGIDNNEMFQKVTQQFNVTLEYQVERQQLTTSTVFKNIFESERKYIKENATVEKEALVKYFQREKLQGKVALVDIGWHGNMQVNLENILNMEGINNDIYGYYIGVKPDDNHGKQVRMKGYIFDVGCNQEIYDDEKQINGMFEQMFMADHGSVKCMRQSNQDIVPVLYSKEQKDKLQRQLISNYQQGALNYVEKLGKELHVAQLSPTFAVDAALQQFLNPNYNDAISWGSLNFKDVGTKKMIAKTAVGNYIFHWKTFLKDYKNSFWKQGFIRVNFRKIRNPNKVILIISKMKSILKKGS